MKNGKWYSLPPLPTLLVVLAAAGLLVYVFRAEAGAFLTYFSYLFSTWALIVGVAGAIRLFRALGKEGRDLPLIQKLHANEHTARYLDDALFRTQINLYFGTAVNALYIFLKFFSGLALRSGWLIVFAVYYTVLTILRASLIHYVIRRKLKQDLRAEYRRYRLTGILLLGLNAALSGIVAFMIARDDASVYPGHLIYAMAAYTFYAVILAVVGLVRFRRHGSPVLSAIKAVNLAAAVAAMMSLEAAMLRRFGSGDDSVFRHTMLGISGLVAFLILLSISAYMIVHANRKLKEKEN